MQQYIIHHHKVNVKKKNEFYERLQKKIDDGKEVTVETLLREANGHAESDRLDDGPETFNYPNWH